MTKSMTGYGVAQGAAAALGEVTPEGEPEAAA